jgi:hypothetical protein
MKLATKFRNAMLAILQTRAELTSPYHPAYGLPDDTRERAVRLAESVGIEAAAAEFNVAKSTIYRWRSDYATSASST